MAFVLAPFRWFYHEFGLVSIHETGRNAYLIILARACRMLAYGTNALVLGTSHLMKPLPPNQMNSRPSISLTLPYHLVRSSTNSDENHLQPSSSPNSTSPTPASVSS